MELVPPAIPYDDITHPEVGLDELYRVGPSAPSASLLFAGIWPENGAAVLTYGQGPNCKPLDLSRVFCYKQGPIRKVSF
jgi:hypothetical protein